jgi:NACalpha-BTF3-like transcription factor
MKKQTVSAKNAQQTAVEWFYQRILAEDIKVVFEQAKAMEKEQIKNAYWNGTTDMEKEDALLMAEDYFNEYYKK